ncbi:hypothetical protein J1N35_012892 [Gossypium stocksii]|uniref:Uncharacterized protein n=1 Tax=Gossypium stocksii TaxID=47602 RepID=A0A9D3VTW4_9ROSI|nr:hypothetical protein J1N35_012892 [Gossypium stocksii]
MKLIKLLNYTYHYYLLRYLIEMPDVSLSFDNWMEPRFSSSESIEPNHEKNIDDVIENLNYDPLFDNNQSDEVQSSSSDSEDETTLKEQGAWCEQDIKAYLLSRFTSKEYKRLDKWQRIELNGYIASFDVLILEYGMIIII